MNQHMRGFVHQFRPRIHGVMALAAVVCALDAGAQSPFPGQSTGGAQEQAAAPAPAQDRYMVKWTRTKAKDGDAAASAAPEVDSTPTGPRSGRLILFFVPDQERWDGVYPADAPFFEKLQPIASIALAEPDFAALERGDAVTVSDGPALRSFRGPLDGLDGPWKVQAVLDRDFTERGHLGPGNIVSAPIGVELHADGADEVRIDLTLVVEPTEPPAVAGVEWIERSSALLTRHAGREVKHRAGVVLPFGYDDLGFDRRMWPTIFVIGGFGANHLAAADAAAALRAPEARAVIPQAVWVFLDAETPWGHHGFCDSETNGPVGTALVEEFIPFLEERFRLIAEPSARIVTGHSSGGWSVLHLALTYPSVFGACFASSPDPVDFAAFQRTNLYLDASLFVTATGEETPSFRAPLGPELDRVLMTVRDEIETELAIDPSGRSGEQWAAWEAMWSPYDAKLGRPRPLCDASSGAIDPVTVEAWSKFDLARRFDRDPDAIGTLIASRVRLLCGARDSFYLNEAVARLRDRFERWRGEARARGAAEAEGPGSIELLDGLTHDSAYPAAMLRFHHGMTEHLRRHGHGEAPPLPAALDPGRERNPR
jgi:predicted esterase